MIAHDELVARQGIECLLKFLGLRDREVARHSPSGFIWRCRSPCPAALVKNVNDCVSTNGKGAGEQAVEHADHARRRIFLDAEHGADASLGRQPVLDGLKAEKQPTWSRGLVQWRAREGHRSSLTRHQEAQKLEQTRMVTPRTPIRPEPLRLVAIERGAQDLGKLLARVQCILNLELCFFGFRARKKPGDPTRRYPCDRSVDEGQVELVDHERLIRQARAIFGLEPPGEPASFA